jgi:hypothetical protein
MPGGREKVKNYTAQELLAFVSVCLIELNLLIINEYEEI